MHEQMNLMRHLKINLEHYDLTAAQLSRKSGVSQQVISPWLRGAEPKKRIHVKSVSEALGCTVDYLCFGVGLHKSFNPNLIIDNCDWLSGIFEIKVRKVK